MYTFRFNVSKTQNLVGSRMGIGYPDYWVPRVRVIAIPAFWDWAGLVLRFFRFFGGVGYPKSY